MKRFLLLATTASAIQVRLKQPELDDCADAKTVPEVQSGLVQVKEPSNAQQSATGVSFLQRDSTRFLSKPPLPANTIIDEELKNDQFDEDLDTDTSFVQLSSGGAVRAGLGAGASLLALCACCIAIKKFCGGFCGRCRFRKACRCCLPCLRCCGCDSFENFKMKLHINELSEQLSGMYQIRLEHDTRVYKTSTSSKCSWNETLQVWCQQGVSHIHVELWHIPTVGSESLAAECSINIKRDVIDRNYPQNVMLMLRRRGKRVAMCSISFFRPGSDNDILSKLSDNISEDLRYRVAKAAQKPSKEAICLSDDLIQRSKALYGPDVAALQALATVSSGPLKQPHGLLGMMAVRYFAVIHDPNRGPLEGWYLARWESLQSRELQEKPDRRIPIASIMSVKTSNKKDEFVMVWAKQDKKKQKDDDESQLVMVLQAMDRSRDVWVEGLRLFICNLHNLALRDQRRNGALKLLNESLAPGGEKSRKGSRKSKGDASREGTPTRPADMAAGDRKPSRH